MGKNPVQPEKPASDKGLHSGHRQRVKEKFLQSGFDSFNDHEILEMLLFYVVPRKDTNELAHQLIRACGSLSAVFDAPPEFLRELGMSDNVVVFFKAILQFNHRYLEDRFYSGSKQYNRELIRQRLVSGFCAESEEKVALMLYDAKGRELFFGTISHGTYNSSELNLKKISEMAVKYSAAFALIAHNHPRGIAYPSDQDIDATLRAKKILRSIGVELKDHLIVSAAKVFSMAEDPILMEVLL